MGLGRERCGGRGHLHLRASGWPLRAEWPPARSLQQKLLEGGRGERGCPLGMVPNSISKNETMKSKQAHHSLRPDFWPIAGRRRSIRKLLFFHGVSSWSLLCGHSPPCQAWVQKEEKRGPGSGNCQPQKLWPVRGPTSPRTALCSSDAHLGLATDELC